MRNKSYQLHYEEYGKGSPVVLLHGFLATSRYWEPSIPQLARKHRVIVIDLLGFGKSPRPKHSRYDFKAHIASLKLTLDTLGLEDSSYKLVGHSMGSLIALRYATLFPQNISKLVLTNMPIMLGKREVRRHIYTNPIVRLGLTPYIHRLTWGTVKKLYEKKLLPKKGYDALHKNIDYVFEHGPIARMKSFRNVIMKARVDIDLKKLDVRTTLLNGVYDRGIYLQNLGSKIQLGPHIDIKNFDTYHHIPRVMPEVLARELR